MTKQDVRNIWLLFREIAGREKKTVVCMFLTIILGAFSPYITILCTGMILDGIYEGASVEKLLSYVAAAFTVRLIVRIIEMRASEWMGQKQDYTRELDERELNRKSLVMDYECLEDTGVQELRNRALARSFYGIRGWMLLITGAFLRSILSVVIALVIVMPLIFTEKTGNVGGAGSAWASVLLFLILSLVVWADYKRGVHYTRKAEGMLDGLDGVYNKSNYYMDMLSGVESQKDLRMNGQQNVIERDVDALFTASQEGERRMGREYIIRTVLARCLSAFSGLCVYLFTGLRAQAGVITIGNVAAYASSIVQLTVSASRIAISMGRMKSVASYAKDYLEFQNLGGRKYEGTIPVEKRRDNRFQVEFEHVSFRYPGTDRDVIKDLNLSFVIGEKMAIVGKNGSGKTTFIKLLCRLYDVTEGCIKVNGIDIRKYDYREYCRLFGVVFQDFVIFAFPVGENIAAGASVEAERAEDAIRRAGLGERFEELEDGFNTFVGKEFSGEGVAFSGGEKQKIAIARAIYRNAPFVIMDEPTAALDPIAECDVYAGFDKMVGAKTALYISHRLASCRFCKDILVFDEGRVVQRGSHEELEKQEGLYRELWNAQAQYYS